MNSCPNCKGPEPQSLACVTTQAGAIVELRWCQDCGCAFRRNANGWDIYIPAVSAVPGDISPRKYIPDAGAKRGERRAPSAAMVSFEDVRSRAREDEQTGSTLARPGCDGCEAAYEAHDGLGWCAEHGQIRVP